MKYFTFLLWLILVQADPLQASGIDFFKGTFDEAKEKANEEGRLVFVDAYTTWCGPCKRMSSNVFTKDEVGSFYNEHFVNVKLDMEKGEGKKFQQKYRVTAFPTLLFLNPEGKVVHKVVGGMDVPNFLKLGKFAATKSDVSSKLEKAYQEGQRDPAFMAQYVQALSKSNRPRIKIVNEYLNKEKTLPEEDRLSIIFYGLEEVDSKIFNAFAKHRKKIEQKFGSEAVDKQIERAASKTVAKGIEFSNLDLVEEAIEKVNRYSKVDTKVFAGRSRLAFYQAMQDWDSYLKIAKEYAKMGTEQKFELANEILHKMQNQSTLMTWGERWAIEAASKDDNEHHQFIAAKFCYKNAHYAKAKKHGEAALNHAKKTKSQTIPHIEQLLKSVTNKMNGDKS